MIRKHAKFVARACFFSVAATIVLGVGFAIVEARSGNHCQVASICLDELPPQCTNVMDVSTIRDSSVPIAKRCGTAHSLRDQGVKFDTRRGIEALDLLGRPFLVDYDVVGTVDVSAHKLAFLLDHLPFTAKLISTYRGGDYFAEYKTTPSGPVVKGGKGDRFTGEARLLAGEAKKGRLIYHGFGTANVAKWSFHGEVMIDFEFQPDPKHRDRSVYRIRSHASPGNSMLNALMDSEPFRAISETMVKGLIDDLAHTVKAIDKDSRRGRKNRDRWTDDEREKIKRLMRLK